MQSLKKIITIHLNLLGRSLDAYKVKQDFQENEAAVILHGAHMCCMTTALRHQDLPRKNTSAFYGAFSTISGNVTEA